jgi:acyl-CoA synthetase (AMP-forming)/AMP-acid ligase II/thioesterase domain-containing protein/acyl carrier protein
MRSCEGQPRYHDGLMDAETVGSLIAALANDEPDRPVLLDAEGFATSRADAARAVASWAARIDLLGVGGDARVAVALPNGTSMATAFLGIAANVVCAPLNPRYTDAEAEFYLTDLGAALLVVDGDTAPGVRAAAEHGGVPILDLAVEPISAVEPSTVLSGRRPGDIALILHTSGTTSRPKQVPLTHANLLASARSIQSTLGLEPADRCANVMPLFHIHGLVACLLASLNAGASVVCTAGFDPQNFLRVLDGLGCSWYSAVPTIHQAVLSAAAASPGEASKTRLRFIRSSSSSLPPSVMHRLEEQFGVPVIEAYGMTEAAHQMASNQLPPGGRRAGSVGIAAGPEISVVDADGNQLRPGAVGELVIRGDNVMSGYISPPEANDDAFFGDWFRTGDQGTMDADGIVTLTGRLKELINRAGEKIAPREIDEALLADADISEALAFAIPHPTLGEDVGAVVVPADKDHFDASAVLDRLRARLSDHKIPRRLVVVEALPLGATGKPARIGLAEKLGLGTTSAGSPDAVPDSDPLVAAVGAVLGSVLGLPAVGPHDDFVAIGGDSLSALTAAIAIEDAFGVSIPAGMLLGTAGTPTTLAAAIRSEREHGGPIDGVSDALSNAARRLWTMQQIEPGSTAYNVGLAVRLRGPLGGTDAIDQAIHELVERHPALRTLITIDDGELRASPTAPLPAIDRRELAPEQIAGFVAEILNRPIDLGLAPLHVGIGCIDDQDHVVVLASHHALVDGPSRQILRRDLVHLLEHRQLPSVGTAAQRPVRVREASREFWQTELGDPPSSPDLPAPGPSSSPGVERAVATISGSAFSDLRELARGRGMTLFSLLMAAHAEALRRVGAQDDVVIAVPVTNRPPSDDTTVGMYIETIPVRLRLGEVESVDALLKESSRAVTGALSHGDVPFDELVEIASLQRSVSARPLAGTMCQLRPPVLDDEAPDALSVEDLDASPSAARFDLAVDFIDRDNHLEIVVEHDRMAIAGAHGRRHAARVARVLEGFITESALAAIDICCHDERAEIARIGRSEHENEPERLDLVAALDALAVADPDATAIIDGDRTVTRAALMGRSRAFAAAFAAQGASESRPVGIALPRGVDAVAGMIGAWRVGAPYVTFDSSGPTERDRAVSERCNAAVVLATTGGWNIPTIDPADVVDDKIGWRTNRTPTTAWILSTSGSSGEPKLVPGSMVALVNRLQWGQRVIPITGPTAHRAPLVFVDHAAEIFEPLLAGQPLVVVDDETVRDPRRLATLIETTGMTRLLVVPTLMRMLLAGLDNGRQLTSIETVLTSGEPLPSDVADRWLSLLPRARLVNVYGATEVGPDATAGEVSAGGSVTVGKPIDGMRTQVVSSSGPPSPPGCVGEIWISGVGVMSGYLDRDPDGSLVDRDLDGATRTWYRTGDRGRFDPHGDLVVVGRADKQLKVRGVRIDPMEIEMILRSRTGAVDAAVYVRDDVLSAVLVGLRASEFDARSVRLALSESLPPSHIPARIEVVDELPRTATGKLARSALSSLGNPLSSPARPPESPTERWLAERWTLLIPGTSALSVEDDFFSIGGQSLTAVELFTQIEQELGLDLPVSAIFEAPSIQSLARIIDTASKNSPDQPGGLVHQISSGSSGSPTVAWCVPATAGVLGELGDHLGPHVGLIGLETPGNRRGEPRPRRIEQIAVQHANEVRSLELTGPLVVGGNSFGGLVALALVRQLRKDGLEPDLLVIVDSWSPSTRPVRSPMSLRWRQFAKKTWRTLPLAGRFARNPKTHPWSSVSEYWRTTGFRDAKNVAAARFTDVEPLDTPTIVFATDERRRISGQQDLGWGDVLRGPLEVVELEGSHGNLLTGTRGDTVGEELARRLRVGAPSPG